MSKSNSREHIKRTIRTYDYGPLLIHDPTAPLPEHVAKCRAVQTPCIVPVMCANVYCREWVFGASCARCGTERPAGV